MGKDKFVTVGEIEGQLERQAVVSSVIDDFIRNHGTSFAGSDIEKSFDTLKKLSNIELYGVLENLEIGSFPHQLFIAIVSLLNCDLEDAKYLELSPLVASPLRLLITALGDLLLGKGFVLEKFDVIKTQSPEKYTAFLQDFRRLVKMHGYEMSPEFQFSGDMEFEDPFHLGLKEKYKPENNLGFTDQMYGYWQDEKDMFQKYASHFDTIRKTKRNEINKEYWDRLTKLHPLLGPEDRITEYQIMIRKFKSQEKVQGIRSLMLELAERDPLGVNFRQIFRFVMDDSPWRNEFIEVFQSNSSVRNYIYQVIKNGSPFISASAILTISKCGGIRSDLKKKYFLELVDTLFQNVEDLNEEKYVSMVVNTGWIMQESLNGDFVGRVLHMDFVRAELNIDPEKTVEDYRREVIRRVPILKYFAESIIVGDKPDTRETKFLQLTPKGFLSELNFPASFDPKSALEKIRSDKSWAPTSPRVISEMFGIKDMGYEFQIEPLSNSTAVDDWRIRILFTSLEKGRLKKNEIDLVFKRGALASHNVKNLSAHARQNAEKLGIYIAHGFYVREMVNRQTDMVSKKVERVIEPEDETDIPKDRSNDGVEEIPSARPRKQQPGFNIDLREKDKDEVESNKKIVGENIKAREKYFQRALEGDLSDENLEHILLYRKVSVTAGEDIYERYKPEEVKEIIGNRKFEDVYYLESFPNVPHLRDVGYMQYQSSEFRDLYEKVEDNHGLEEISVPENNDRNEVGMEIRKFEFDIPIYMVKKRRRTDAAELKYLMYQESQLPDLGGFSEFNSVINLILDDHYVDGEINCIQIKNDNGEEEEHMWKSINPEKTGLNAKLALKMRNKNWQNAWIETQRRELNEKLQWLQSDLESKSEDLDLKVEIARVQDELERLEELSRLVSQNCKIKTYADGGKADVYLTMGWFKSEKTFNQGCFRPVSVLVERIAAEKAECEVREVAPA